MVDHADTNCHAVPCQLRYFSWQARSNQCSAVKLSTLTLVKKTLQKNTDDICKITELICRPILTVRVM